MSEGEIERWDGAGWLVDQPQSDDVASIELRCEHLGAFVTLLDAVADEARVTVSEGGLQSRVTGSANVAAAEVTLSAYAFDGGDITTDVEVGWILDRVDSTLPKTNDGLYSSEPVAVDVGCNATRVSRSPGSLELCTDVENLEPSKTRGCDNDFEENVGDWEATVPVWQLVESVQQLDRSAESAIGLVESDGGLVLACDGDYAASAAHFPGVAEIRDDGAEPGDSSSFTAEYLLTAATALQDAGVDEVTLVWDDNFPLTIEFGRRTGSGDPLLHGRFQIAPIINGGSEIEWGEQA